MENEILDFSRRKFVKNSVILGGMLPFAPILGELTMKSRPNSELEIHVFSKHLQFLDYTDMAKKAAEIGFDGVDLTVRPKGHVLPENVARDLPKAVKAIKDAGLLAKMMVSRIESADAPETAAILEAASKEGFQFYRSGYFSYRKGHSVQEDIAYYQSQAKELSKLNKKWNIVGCYQNHAGTRMGASIWELSSVLEKVKNENYGVQYDIRHAVVEGGLSWVNGLRLIAPRIKTLVLKDFNWEKVNGSWKLVNTPFGEGMVDFEAYFKMLKQLNIQVPMSMHFEYELGGANHGAFEINTDPKIVYNAMKRDLSRVRALWASV